MPKRGEEVEAQQMKDEPDLKEALSEFLQAHEWWPAKSSMWPALRVELFDNRLQPR